MTKAELNGKLVPVPAAWLDDIERARRLRGLVCMSCNSLLNVRNRDGLCMECRKTYPELADYINPNRTSQNKRWHRRNRWLMIYKQAKGCELCGYNASPYALDFDHVDRNTKYAAIGKLVNGKLDRLFEELRKCRVLCANCHRIHTQTQLRE